MGPVTGPSASARKHRIYGSQVHLTCHSVIGHNEKLRLGLNTTGEFVAVVAVYAEAAAEVLYMIAVRVDL